jgi:hypothetical protein
VSRSENVLAKAEFAVYTPWRGAMLYEPYEGTVRLWRVFGSRWEMTNGNIFSRSPVQATMR